MKIKEIKMANNDYTTKELCDVFEINQSTYFDRAKEKPLAVENNKIVTIIKQTATETQHTYGKR